MGPETVDQVRLNFDEASLTALNAVIGLMMFGMALDMRLEDFRRVVRSPKGPAIGLAAQFLLLPAFTFLLTFVLPVVPSMALGMMLVAACPGGNLSNLITYLARGNAALSVSMTAVSTAAAIVMTPLNLSLWGSLQPDTAPILRQVSLSPLDVLGTIVLILGIPLAAGLGVSKLLPSLAKKVRRPFKIFAIVVFIAVVGMALKANWDYFLRFVGLVAFGVFAHNALALSLGYGSARLFRLPPRDARAVCIEVGIQNSALALVLIFNFFDGLGGMAIIAGWWGVWHIISGLTMAGVFSTLAKRAGEPEEPQTA
ncbi:MAG: bile acid:sodium symporter family protein [Deltaproteobacteria bacterium]|jgi:BASS family bile acid:Na+ symporter|nr:bile acid:sodium symporter family protein [Deltaproteobacteria bacterium]MBW2533125.1 bile acid:sodium symporter family protein [Deltaproteobacteria bacterium]